MSPRIVKNGFSRHLVTLAVGLALFTGSASALADDENPIAGGILMVRIDETQMLYVVLRKDGMVNGVLMKGDQTSLLGNPLSLADFIAGAARACEVPGLGEGLASYEEELNIEGREFWSIDLEQLQDPQYTINKLLGLAYFELNVTAVLDGNLRKQADLQAQTTALTREIAAPYRELYLATAMEIATSSYYNLDMDFYGTDHQKYLKDKAYDVVTRSTLNELDTAFTRLTLEMYTDSLKALEGRLLYLNFLNMKLTDASDKPVQDKSVSIDLAEEHLKKEFLPELGISDRIQRDFFPDGLLKAMVLAPFHTEAP